MLLPELLTSRSKKDLDECCCAGKQQNQYLPLWPEYNTVPAENPSLGSNGGVDHGAGSAGGSPSTCRRKVGRRLGARRVFCRVGHAVSHA